MKRIDFTVTTTAFVVVPDDEPGTDEEIAQRFYESWMGTTDPQLCIEHEYPLDFSEVIAIHARRTLGDPARS